MSYLNRRLKSFSYAFQGLSVLFRTQPNARFHLVAAIGVVAAGFYCKISSIEWGLLVGCMGGVIAAEAVNTAIEKTIDLVSPEHHPLAGQAKDLAAAAVLIMAFCSLVTGILIFGPHLMGFIMP